MKYIRICGVILTTGLAIVLISGCASHRSHQRPSKCDCSRWSQVVPAGTFHLTINEKGPSGRA